MNRNLIGDAIVHSRLDAIEILWKSKVSWNDPCFTQFGGISLTPLQFALAIQRYEIAQFLIDHGARIE